MDKKEYHKINVGLYLFPENKIIEDGKLSFDIEFMNRLQDYLYVFRSAFTKPITETIGEDWAINFIQVDLYNVHFFVDIYIDNPDHFTAIKNIVNKRLQKDFKCDYFLRGNVEAYIGNQ